MQEEQNDPETDEMFFIREKMWFKGIITLIYDIDIFVKKSETGIGVLQIGLSKTGSSRPIGFHTAECFM